MEYHAGAVPGMSQATSELVFLMTDEEAAAAAARLERLSVAWGVVPGDVLGRALALAIETVEVGR
jgi:hypothetical protein